ncbi:MAG: hypothetical protein MRY63_10005 [Neomegalonema sp.]|nr:hypothetical protein [Neomegalonema sp.]
MLLSVCAPLAAYADSSAPAPALAEPSRLASTLAPPPAPRGDREARPASFQSHEQIAAFAIETLTQSGNDAAPLAAAYGAQVSYYGHGMQPREKVLTDKSGLFERWPDRRFSVDLRTISVSETGSSEFQVSFETRFEMRSTDLRSSGRAIVEARIAVSPDGAMTLIAEDGEILSSETELLDTRLAKVE